jgi:hypothetical protein
MEQEIPTIRKPEVKWNGIEIMGCTTSSVTPISTLGSNTVSGSKARNDKLGSDALEIDRFISPGSPKRPLI